MNAETKEVFISIATQIDTKSRHTTVCFICVTIECCGLSSNNERLYKHPKSLRPNRLRWSGVNSVSKLDLSAVHLSMMSRGFRGTRLKRAVKRLAMKLVT